MNANTEVPFSNQINQPPAKLDGVDLVYEKGNSFLVDLKRKLEFDDVGLHWSNDATLDGLEDLHSIIDFSETINEDY